MNAPTKDYLLKTVIAFILIFAGALGVKMGFTVMGGILFLIGFITCLVLYGNKFLWWWH